MAIGIRVKKAPANYDLGASKFFGTPTVPVSWAQDFSDDEIFFCQLRLSDIALFDKDNKLPHSGYLYFFMHTADGERGMKADVRLLEGEPELAIDDFNTAVEGYECFNDAYLMEFYETDESECCTRLFGIPSDWNYEDRHPRLLMQFDPLDNEMGFLDHIDGFLYFFFVENDRNLELISLHVEYS
ncbi:MAG: DUF1963 domain-containing protein [Clostridia bacterium]|nr:DUF1963 domain-containing protein [Clostridia bacterium]